MNQSIRSAEPGTSHGELDTGTSDIDPTGSVDGVVGRNLSDWAADRSNLGRRLVVEVSGGGRLITTSVAGEFREDLSGAGIGDGKHGFRCTIPDSCGTGPTLTVKARVQGTDCCLIHSGERNVQLEFSTFLNYVAADIADNSNLRCPFCLVDYSRLSSRTSMRSLGLSSTRTSTGSPSKTRSVPPITSLILPMSFGVNTTSIGETGTR